MRLALLTGVAALLVGRRRRRASRDDLHDRSGCRRRRSPGYVCPSRASSPPTPGQCRRGARRRRSDRSRRNTSSPSPPSWWRRLRRASRTGDRARARGGPRRELAVAGAARARDRARARGRAQRPAVPTAGRRRTADPASSPRAIRQHARCFIDLQRLRALLLRLAMPIRIRQKGAVSPGRALCRRRRGTLRSTEALFRVSHWRRPACPSATEYPTAILVGVTAAVLTLALPVEAQVPAIRRRPRRW